MKNVCIVGFGAIGRTHAKTLFETANARLYGVCDINSQKCEDAKEQYENIILFDNFDKMLEDNNIDAVHICTPHYLHFEMVKKALKKGKLVVCEKPVVMKKEEFDELLMLEDSDKICVVFQNRLNPCVVKAKEIVDQGDFGKIVAVKGILTWERNKEYYSDDWHGKLATEGGGVLINQAIHTFDYFNYVAGGITSVKANMLNLALDIEVEDTFVASLKLACGAKGVFFATNTYGANTKPEFEIVFENGILKYSDSQLILNGEVVAEDSKEFLGKSCWGMGHIGIFKRFYDSGKFFSPFDVKDTMYGVYAMYESAKCGGKEVIVEG